MPKILDPATYLGYGVYARWDGNSVELIFRNPTTDFPNGHIHFSPLMIANLVDYWNRIKEDVFRSIK